MTDAVPASTRSLVAGVRPGIGARPPSRRAEHRGPAARAIGEVGEGRERIRGFGPRRGGNES